MSRAPGDLSMFLRASAASAALAFFFAAAPIAAGQEAQPEPAAEQPEAEPAAVGGVLVPAGGSGPASHLLPLLGRAVAWAAGERGDAAWRDFGAEVAVDPTDGPDRAWSLTAGDGGLQPAPRDDAEIPAAQAIAFDLSLDCNAFRDHSPQPFSRTVRGRALDALTIDNARRARLTGLYADPDDRSAISLVLFTESRAQPPGRWQANPLATISMAPNRGDPKPPLPVLVDFGERWVGVVFALADLALAVDPESDTISTIERFDAWGMARTTALRQLGAGFDGRVWLWPGQGEESIVCSLPLSRGSTDRRVADGLRSVFGQRLRWARDDSGRVTATLRLGRGDDPAGRALSLRFITIADRTTLTIATHAADLDSSAETLADLAR